MVLVGPVHGLITLMDLGAIPLLFWVVITALNVQVPRDREGRRSPKIHTNRGKP